MRHENVLHAALDLLVARTPHWPDNVVASANKAVPLVVLAGVHAVHLPDAERPKCLFAFDLAWPPWCMTSLTARTNTLLQIFSVNPPPNGVRCGLPCLIGFTTLFLQLSPS